MSDPLPPTAPLELPSADDVAWESRARNAPREERLRLLAQADALAGGSA